jgi:hypothetical protein
MAWGGKRTGSGRPTDNKSRKNVHYRIDALTAEKFSEHCKCLRVPLNAVLEMLMTEWMSEHQAEIEHACTELKTKGAEEFCERPCSRENLERLNVARAERRLRLAIVKFHRVKGLGAYLRAAADGLH